MVDGDAAAVLHCIICISRSWILHVMHQNKTGTIIVCLYNDTNCVDCNSRQDHLSICTKQRFSSKGRRLAMPLYGDVQDFLSVVAQ